MTGARLRILLLGLVVLLAGVLPQSAWSHAQLHGSEPAAGSIVEAGPGVVVLTFSEAVSPLVLRWIAPDGSVTEVQGEAENARITVMPPAMLGDGTHLLSWRIASADGHPVGGTLTFHVGAPSVTPRGALEPVAGTARIVAGLRFLLTVALVVAVGGAVLAAVVARGPLPASVARLCLLAAGLTTPVGIALVGAQGLDLLSLPVSALLTSAPWGIGLSSSLAVTVALSLAAALLAVVAFRGPVTGRGCLAALAGWGLAAISFAVSGHAGTAPPRWLAAPAVALHALALIYWIGALLPLRASLRQPDGDRILRRFSTLAIPLVAVLVLSGAALVWMQSGDPAALLASGYGAVLGVKLVLVTLLLGLAVRNRLVLTPAVSAGQAWAIARMDRAIRAEIALGLLILAVASGFRLTPPPRALPVQPEPIHAHFHNERAMADLRIAPGRAGPVEIAVALQTGDFAELVPREVELLFALPEAGIQPIRIDALPGDDGQWHSGTVTLPLAGDWRVTLRLLVSDFESVTITDNLTLPP